MEEQLLELLTAYQEQNPSHPVPMRDIARQMKLSIHAVNGIYNKLANDGYRVPPKATKADFFLDSLSDLAKESPGVPIILSSVARKVGLSPARARSVYKSESSKRDLPPSAKRANTEKLSSLDRDTLLETLLSKTKKRKWKKPRSKTELELFDQQVMEFVNLGLSGRQIADELGRNYHDIRNSCVRLRRTGKIEPRSKGRKPNNHVT
jgi:hypothetical protein